MYKNKINVNILRKPRIVFKIEEFYLLITRNIFKTSIYQYDKSFDQIDVRVFLNSDFQNIVGVEPDSVISTNENFNPSNEKIFVKKISRLFNIMAKDNNELDYTQIEYIRFVDMIIENYEKRTATSSNTYNMSKKIYRVNEYYIEIESDDCYLYGSIYTPNLGEPYQRIKLKIEDVLEELKTDQLREMEWMKLSAFMPYSYPLTSFNEIPYNTFYNMLMGKDEDV